jgi:hypothetical protein
MRIQRAIIVVGIGLVALTGARALSREVRYRDALSAFDAAHPVREAMTPAQRQAQARWRACLVEDADQGLHEDGSAQRRFQVEGRCRRL